MGLATLLSQLHAHVGENSPPDCFLPQTAFALSCSSPVLIIPQNKKSRCCDSSRLLTKFNLRGLGFVSSLSTADYGGTKICVLRTLIVPAAQSG